MINIRSIRKDWDLIESLINEQSKILDVGCGKGFLLFEMLKIEPNLIIRGFDISDYALKRVKKSKNLKVFKHKAEKKFPFKSNYFDLAISLATLHNLKNFDLSNSIKEIERVGKKKIYYG